MQGIVFTLIIVRVALGFSEPAVETTPRNISRHSILAKTNSTKNDKRGWRSWIAWSRSSLRDHHNHHPMEPLSVVVTQLTHSNAASRDSENNVIVVPGTTLSVSGKTLNDYDEFNVKFSTKNSQDVVSFLRFHFYFFD